VDARQPGRLYVVATPIGNLSDLSPRAVEVLSRVDVVAAEDTRVTGKLLARVGIDARLVSYRDHNERVMAPKLIERLQQGESVALACDAGTPCISDPGYRLVHRAAEEGIEIVSVPGPCALTALLSVCGLPTDRFSFEGFLPSRAPARRKALRAMDGAGRTVVVYESPRRVIALLDEVAELLSDPPVAVGRELTKLHEEVLRGSASHVAELLRSGSCRGEFVVAIYVAEREGVELQGEALEAEVRRLRARGMTAKDVAAALKERGVPRRLVYQIARTR
jgi:16S rRNA (cytidine1402-2'-O)-methyltransferase